MTCCVTKSSSTSVEVVRQGLVIGEPSYSIKKVERLYRDQREGEVSTSMGSVVAYAGWTGELANPRTGRLRRCWNRYAITTRTTATRPGNSPSMAQPARKGGHPLPSETQEQLRSPEQEPDT